jgi:hypothetical protein
VVAEVGDVFLPSVYVVLKRSLSVLSVYATQHGSNLYPVFFFTAFVRFSIPGTPDYGIITPRDNFPGKIGLVDRLIISKRT